MLSLLEVIAGFVLVYFGLSSVRREAILGFLAGVVSIAGLLMIIHGTLIFNVPDFFE